MRVILGEQNVSRKINFGKTPNSFFLIQFATYKQGYWNIGVVRVRERKNKKISSNEIGAERGEAKHKPQYEPSSLKKRFLSSDINCNVVKKNFKYISDSGWLLNITTNIPTSSK